MRRKAITHSGHHNSTERKSDLFISYSSKDRAFVERLARDLMENDVKVWIDTLEMQIGDSLHKKIESGISTSGWLGVVLSPDSVASPWVEKELNAALELELEKQSVFVLPLLYRECKIPLFLRDKVYADFRRSYHDGRDALLKRLKPALNPRTLEVLMTGSPSAIKATFSGIPSQNKGLYVARIRQSLAAPSVSARIAAITALFAVKDKALLVDLTNLAGDPSASVRRFALFYLGELRTRNALAIVSEHMSDPNPEVRAAAREAFKKLPGTLG